MNDMTRVSQRGYYVKETAPVYFCADLARTCQRFRVVLSWYGDTFRDKQGTAAYGCIFDYPGGLIVANLTPSGAFTCSAASPPRASWVLRQHPGARRLPWFRLKERLGTNYTQRRGARECVVTTVDGTLIRFFETTD